MRCSVTSRKVSVNRASENRSTDSRAFRRMSMSVSASRLKIVFRLAANESASEARKPVLCPLWSRTMSSFGPPDSWASAMVPAAMHSTTPDSKQHCCFLSSKILTITLTEEQILDRIHNRQNSLCNLLCSTAKKDLSDMMLRWHSIIFLVTFF